MFKAIKAGRYDFPSPFWDDIQPGAKDMIGCLLMLDTEKRYTAQQVKIRNDDDVPKGKLRCLA